MNIGFVRRTSGRALVVAAMSAALIGGASAAASASVKPATGNSWYVSTTGHDAGNNCSNSAHPCATIDHALAEQAAEAVTGTVNVAAGTYQQQVTAGSSNSGVTIKGAGTSTVIEPPSTGLASDTDTDSSQPQFYVIDVGPGTGGFGIKDLTVNGLNASSFFDGDGDGCAQDFVGIYYHESSGSIGSVKVTGIDLPADLFGCQGGLGIYVNSASGDSANVTMTKISLTAPTSTSVTEAKLPKGTYSNDILPVKSVPSGFRKGEITVGGYEVSAKKDGSNALLITGTIPTAVKKGSVVNYDAFKPAYDKNGITCDDNYTTCSVTGSTIDGTGPNNAVAQNGIQDFGAATMTIGSTSAPNTVTGNTWTGGGGSGNAAAGLLLLNGGQLIVDDNTVSDNDVNIYAGEVQAYGLAATPGDWTIEGNTVSGATSEGESAGSDGYGEGIQVDGTTNDVAVEGNTVSTSAQANILLTGVSGAYIGGPSSGEGNTVSGSSAGAGIVVGGPSTECEAEYGNDCAPNTGNTEQFSSTGDTIEDNTVSDNGGGVVVEGTYDPAIVGQSDPDAAYSNTFTGNTWSGNVLANVADFSTQGDTGGTANTYTDNSCEPMEGASLSLDSLTGGAVVGDTTVNGTDVSTTTPNGFANVDTTEGVIDGAGAISPGTTVTAVNSTTDVTISPAATFNVPDGQDTVGFGYDWGC